MPRLLRLSVFIAIIATAWSFYARSHREVLFTVSEISIISHKKQRHKVTVELAETDDQRRRGLMYRDALPQGQGMLFIFPDYAPGGMWMKDTAIPLDMLFTDDRGKIIYIAERTTPLSETIIGPDEPIKAVLELNAGSVERLNLHIGDRIEHASLASH